MSSIIFILLAFLLGLLLLMVASIWYMNFLLKSFIGKKHEWIQFILDTSTVPACWSRGYNRKLYILSRRGSNDIKIASIQEKARNKYLHKLDKLVRYIKVTNLVESEEVRSQVLNQLLDVRKQWERGEGLGWTQI